MPAGLSGVTAIAAGRVHSLALRSDGSVVAWGDNTYGESTVPGLDSVDGAGDPPERFCGRHPRRRRCADCAQRHAISGGQFRGSTSIPLPLRSGVGLPERTELNCSEPPFGLAG